MSAPSFPLTPDGLKATHKHLFQDVFPWAGQVRTVGLTHPRHQDPFAFPHFVEGSLAKQFRELAANGDLAGLDAPTFAGKAAHHVGELNAIHACRDGNDRTMRLHLQQLAAGAGHRLDVTRLQIQAWNDASNISFRTGDSSPLAAVILQGVGPTGRSVDKVAQTTAALSPDGRLVYAALAERLGQQMTRLGAPEKAELRERIARDLALKETREGPVVLTPEQRRLAGAPKVSPEAGIKGERIGPAATSPVPSRRPRRGC